MLHPTLLDLSLAWLALVCLKTICLWAQKCTHGCLPFVPMQSPTVKDMIIRLWRQAVSTEVRVSFRWGVLSFERSFAVKIRRIKVMFFICHCLVSSFLHFIQACWSPCMQKNHQLSQSTDGPFTRRQTFFETAHFQKTLSNKNGLVYARPNRINICAFSQKPVFV